MEKKMICRHFLSFLFVVLSVSFFGLFITTQNSFAVDSLTVSYSSGQTLSSTPMFPDCDRSCYEDYHYLHVHVDNPNYNNMSGATLYMKRRSNTYTNEFSINAYLDAYYDISLFYELRYYGNWGTSLTNITFTLLDSLPSPGCPEPPSGDLSITSNGTYDVTSYAQATVNVPAEVIQGDYHNDLVNIQKSIIICGAILLVLYFFYCIYRLIIKNSGVH